MEKNDRTQFWVPLSWLEIGDVFQITFEGHSIQLRKEGRAVCRITGSHSRECMILPFEKYVQVEVSDG